MVSKTHPSCFTVSVVFLIPLLLAASYTTAKNSPILVHNKNQPFLECISIHDSNSTRIQEQIYAPNSPSYIDSLLSASQNQRWLNLTHQRPSFIVLPNEPDEVRPVILCCKEFGFQVRAKSGGHDYEGLSFRSKTRFIMVDLSNLNKTTINVKKETAWIQTGVTLGQLYYEISNKSNTLAFPGGLYRGVGSGGHISGGGLGTLLRKYGLASDNVLDAHVMDVNGTILDRKSMGEDLFWAIRGGGGASFGVILAWKLKLVRVPEKVTYFSIRRVLAPENLDLLQKWQNKAYKLPQELFIRVLLSRINETTVKILYQGLFLGTAKELVPLLNTVFPEFGLETKDCFPETARIISNKDLLFPKDCGQGSWVQSVLYFVVVSTTSPPTYLLHKSNFTFSFQKATSDFLQAPVPNQALMMIRDMLLSENNSMVLLDPFGGRMDEIGETETPFPHRKGNLFNVQYITNWKVNTEEESSKHLKWIRDMYGKMEPYVARSPRSAYLNYKDLGLGKNDQNCSYDQAKVWGEKYFKGNFEKLARIKGKVDPWNFFRNEQSIPVLL